MIISAMLSFVGLACLVSLIFRLAIYALPAFVGISITLLMIELGAGLIASPIVGLFAAILSFVIGQWAFTHVQSSAMRWLIASLFSGPAGLAGFSMVKTLSQLGGASDSWTLAFGVLGGITVAISAHIRLAQNFDRPSAERNGYFDVVRQPPSANDR